MQRHPRIRRAVKWGGLAATVVLAAAWLGSAWFCAWAVVSDRTSLGCSQGRFMCYRVVSDNPPTVGYAWRAYWLDAPGLRWSLDGPHRDQIGQTTLISAAAPVWMFLLPTTCAAVWAWRVDSRLRRRERDGCCLTCGYSRVGLGKDAACPECGKGR